MDENGIRLGPKLGSSEFVSSSGARVVVPRDVTVSDPSGYDVQVVIDSISGNLRARAITVTARDGAPPVDGGVLRRLRIGEIVREAIAAIPVELPKKLPEGVMHFSRSISENAHRHTSPTAEALNDLSLLHSHASELGLPEKLYVKKQMNITDSQARYWTQLARKQGFLPPSSRDA